MALTRSPPRRPPNGPSWSFRAEETSVGARHLIALEQKTCSDGSKGWVYVDSMRCPPLIPCGLGTGG